MIDRSHLKQSAKVGVIAASLVVGYPTLVSAHSFQACVDDVIDFCRSVHGYTPEGDACIDSGGPQCIHHSHHGTVPKPPDPNMRGNSGHVLNQSSTLKSQ